MVADVRYAFGKVVEAAEWMDNDTRTVALEKSSTMRTYISHPLWLYNVSALDEFYASVRFRFIYVLKNTVDSA